MQFKNPELLYALFLLIIPILVHLFQLRRFRPQEFTNVKFLKKAVLQTRKSSQLKKYLILFTRLLLLASAILAFAQPYFPSAAPAFEKKETVIYLDNSYSMQAKGKNGVLLKRGIQDLLENIPEEETVTLFTNDSEVKNVSGAELRKTLQQLDYSAGQLDLNQVLLKARNSFSSASGNQKNFIAISDFQQRDPNTEPLTGINTYLVNMKPNQLRNVSLDTAFLEHSGLEEYTLAVSLKASEENLSDELPVALYDGKKLLAKKTLKFEETPEIKTSFTLPAEPIKNGILRIEDNGLSFDDVLYFSINEVDPVQVVIIGKGDDTFLKRIYTEPEFEVSSFAQESIDYTRLSQTDVVVLNELNSISSSIANSLKQLLEEQVYLIVIPSENADIQSYNYLFRNTGFPSFSEKILQEKLVTEIAFSHPLYEQVFDERVKNFQYPKVQSYYRTTGGGNAVLRYDSGEAFLLERENIFVFTAALNEKNSNFRNSPLIVPTFFNIGNLSVSPPRLYYNVGQPQNINVGAELGPDEILTLSGRRGTFIPRQQRYQNKVELFLQEDPETAGHFVLKQDTSAVNTLSFNLDRRESDLTYGKIKPSENVEVVQNIPDVFDRIQSANEVDMLWKWFVIFALIFLLTEMLILKFLK
ncbi:BatA domain-containing protein [Salinimicrobium soli]|uniref:BatA domain-containing protein n=1 Tax=Salinimicrobium soli TaxID=1254399 RepID=UPI003AAB6765